MILAIVSEILISTIFKEAILICQEGV
jgi:hypothetical protein